MLRAGVVVYEEIQKGRMMSQHVRGLKIRKDMAEEMDRLQEKFIKDLVEQEGRAVESHAFGDHERVRCEHIKNSIRLFADLIARGTTVYPAPEMPPEQAQHFPVY